MVSLDGERVPVLEEERSHFLAQCETGKEFALVANWHGYCRLGGSLIEAEQREVISPGAMRRWKLQLYCLWGIGGGSITYML